MSLQGSIVVVTEHKDAGLIAALEAAGGHPVIDVTWSDASQTFLRVKPVAVVFPDPALPTDHAPVDKLRRAIDGDSGPFLPMIARITVDSGTAFPGALPIGINAKPERLISRLTSALRVRMLHATALRRTEALKGECDDLPEVANGDPLDDATVLVTGRGRTYPGLTTAVGERMGLIGALSIETAAKYLNARDVDGIIIGEGLSPRRVEALVTVLAEDARFRDLPIAMLPDLPSGVDCSRLPNLERIEGEPIDVVERLLPLVRLHAFEARLQRQLAAVDAKGMLDPQTGLFTIRAFLRDFDRAIRESRERSDAMSIARFSFPSPVDRRTSMDAARLVSRMVRSVDYACRASDGSILIVFSGTALRSAHVVARRIASVLRQTMLTSENGDGRHNRIDPTVTLAALKATDTVESLLARVSEPVPVAAQ